MVILAHDTEAPGFNRAGDRDVVRLTAGTELAFVRDLDPQNVLCAFGTLAHPLFVILPRESLTVKAEEEEDLPTDEEFEQAVTEAPEDKPAWQQHMEEMAPQESEIPQGPTHVLEAPPMSREEGQRFQKGQWSTFLDSKHRFVMTQTGEQVTRDAPAGDTSTVFKQPVGTKGKTRSMNLTRFTLHDNDTGMTYEVGSKAEAADKMHEIQSNELAGQGAPEETKQGMIVQRVEGKGGPWFYFRRPDGGDWINKDKPVLKRDLDRAISEYWGSAAAKIAAAIHPMWEHLRPEKPPKETKLKKKRVERKRKTPDWYHQESPRPELFKPGMIKDYVDQYGAILGRYSEARKKYDAAKDQLDDASVPGPDEAVLQEASPLHGAVLDAMRRMESWLVIAGDWAQSVDIPEHKLRPGGEGQPFPLGPSSPLKSMPPESGHISPWNFPQDVKQCLSNLTETIAPFETNVNRLAEIASRIGTSKTAAEWLKEDDPDTEMPEGWSQFDVNKIKELHGKRQEYSEALHLIDEVIEASDTPSKAWPVTLIKRVIDFKESMQDPKKRPPFDEIRGAGQRVEQGLELAIRMNEPMPKELVELIDIYLAMIKPVIVKGQATGGLLDEIRKYAPAKSPATLPAPVPAWMHTQFNPKPEEFPEDPGLRIVRSRPPESLKSEAPEEGYAGMTPGYQKPGPSRGQRIPVNPSWFNVGGK